MKKWLFAFTLLTLLIGTTRLRAEPPIEITKLLRSVEAGLSNLDTSQLAPFTEGDSRVRFQWMRYTESKDWRISPLLIPARDGHKAEEYVVFHRFNSCESAGDHLHKLVRSETGIRIGEEIPETETLGFLITHHTMQITPSMASKSVRIEDKFTLERKEGASSSLVMTRLLADMKIQSLTDKSGKPIPYWRSASLLVFTAPSAIKSDILAVYSGTVNHSGSDYIMDNEMTLNSYWYPVISRLPSTLRLTVTPPKGFTALTHGEIVVEKANSDGTKTLTFENRIPICYFTFDMGKYHVTHIKKSGVDFYAYLMADHTPEKVKMYLERAGACLHWFSKNFAPYPYTRYTLVETLGPFGGALEGYSFATFARGTLGATVHEVSHTWWGGIVPCTYLNSMWNESFASYSDGLYERTLVKPSASSAEQLLPLRKQFAKFYSRVPILTPGNTEFGPSNAVGYGKGAQVLRVLEEEIGQEAILKVAQSFVQNHKRGSAAEWTDIEASVQRVMGKEYRWFFEQWLERIGVPQLKLADMNVEVRDGKIVLSGAILQKGNPYRLTMPITIYGEKAVQDEKIVVTGNRTEFRFEVKETPKLLRLDAIGALLLGIPDTATDDPYTYRFAAGKRQEI
ncbi:MAG: M1 family aminopeptidase [Armatimonadetes bacterium]|nr:M1 family aminopeptidase [Armatimonadota bacterium]